MFRFTKPVHFNSECSHSPQRLPTVDVNFTYFYNNQAAVSFKNRVCVRFSSLNPLNVITNTSICGGILTALAVFVYSTPPERWLKIAGGALRYALIVVRLLYIYMFFFIFKRLHLCCWRPVLKLSHTQGVLICYFYCTPCDRIISV